ncbi:DUF1688 family protein [Roseibium sp. CAU 1637]|uniref:DUF1688 family protein n=1 Tax=Roseibium limicola TaxID=2816037 RepID=A0A939EP10_9HYPH|nr:DUF1688 family protein [Roseibium limicola]MBO0345675.1 DUF1688 family protein [Roseibium limicola]
MSEPSPLPETAAVSDPVKMREAAHEVWVAACAGDVPRITVRAERLAPLAQLLAEGMERAFPDMQMPPLGCWRWLEADDTDRWGIVASGVGFVTAEEMLIAAADLAVLTAVMNIDVAPTWRFEDPFTGNDVNGEKGLAIAALTLMSRGYFSADPARSFQVNAEALLALSEEELGPALQMEGDDHSQALQCMTGHLQRFGEVVGLRSDLFSQKGALRPGHGVLKVWQEADRMAVDTGMLFKTLFNGLAPLWTGGAERGDLILADAWEDFPADDVEPAPSRILSFQAPLVSIAYSLLEPLAWAGIEMENLEVLPPIADFDHVALLIGAGVLELEASDAELGEAEAQATGLALRALSLAAVDGLAEELRRIFLADGAMLPMTVVIATGTRPAARAAALENSDLKRQLASFLSPGGVFWLPFRA